MPVQTFRDTLRQSLPQWLQRGNAARIVYAIGVHVDAFADALVAGVKQRFPNVYSADSLSVLARERRIRRGVSETDLVYASRLQRWLDDHRQRGGPYALLAQLHAHFAPDNFPVELRYHTSPLLGGAARRFRMDVDGNIVRDAVGGSLDSDVVHWARWWLFYFLPVPVAGDGIWDDPGVWDPDPGGDQPLGVWNVTLTLEEVAALRVVPKEWNAAHAFGYIVLLADGVELWDEPAGIWDDPGVWASASTAFLKLSIDG